MTAKVNIKLHELEEMVRNGEIKSFTIQIQSKALLITPLGADFILMPLVEDLQETLQAFFSGINSIAYGSFDYTTLKSMVNARASLDRIAYITQKA